MTDSYEPSAKLAKIDEESEQSDASWSGEESSDASDDEIVGESSNSPTVWEVVHKSAEDNFEGNALEAYISLVKSWHRFKQDPDHRKIMQQMRRYQDGPDEMDFEEALLKAAHKRVHLIERRVEEVKNDETDEDKQKL